jgi:arabinofuranosyltransferase
MALIGCVALSIAGKKRQVIFLATVSVGWLVYVLIIGGDIFPSYRHFIPSMALMGFMVAGCGLLTLGAPFRFSRVRIAIFLLLTLLVLTSDLFAPVETWEREGKQIGLFLHTAFGAKQPLLVSDAAGVVPYFARMEVIDPLGLNDYHIARHPIADRGQGWVGHELGDGSYVLDHKPDLILVSTYQGDMGLAADQQLLADPRFAANYQRIHIDAGPPHPIRAELYMRRVDGKLGIQISSDTESIPAYLATADNANSVRLADGQAELVVPPHGSAQFAAIPLNAGAWKATLEGAGAAQFALHAASGSSPCATCVQAGANGMAGWTIENTSAQPATLTSIALIKNAE